MISVRLYVQVIPRELGWEGWLSGESSSFENCRVCKGSEGSSPSPSVVSLVLAFCATTWENLSIMTPTKYTPELGDEICIRMAAGENLITICESLSLRRSIVSDWARLDVQGFYSKYTRARQQQIEYMLDDLARTVNDSSEDHMYDEVTGKFRTNHVTVQRHRLIADTMKWVICKVVPRVPSFKGTLLEMGNNVINGVETEGLPPEQAAMFMKLVESMANIKKVDEFDEALRVIPVMQEKITEFERLRDEAADR